MIPKDIVILMILVTFAISIGCGIGAAATGPSKVGWRLLWMEIVFGAGVFAFFFLADV